MTTVAVLAIAMVVASGVVVWRTSPARASGGKRPARSGRSGGKPTRNGGGRSRSRSSGPSLPVRTFTAAGGTTSARTVPELAADLTGRGLGASGRAGKRAGAKAGRATGRGLARGGRWAARRAENRAAPRWQARTDGPTPFVTRTRRQSRAASSDDNTTEKDPGHFATDHTTPDQGEQANNPNPAPSGAPSQDAGPGPQQATERTAPVVTMPTTNATTTGGQQANPPADMAQIISRVSSYEPESVTDLMGFMAGETAGMCGYADALTQVVENCVNTVGLDPQSVQGVTEYAEAVTQAANTMALAHRQFMTVYQEVMEAVDKGVRMPHRGRFFNAA